MKQFIVIALMAAFIISCSKTNPGTENPSGSNQNTTPAPVAAFDILNTDNGAIGEGKVLQIRNQSGAALTYLWEFGEGTTSTQAIPDLFYFRLHGQYLVRLTVTDREGRTSVTSKNISVICGRPNPNHDPLTSPVL